MLTEPGTGRHAGARLKTRRVRRSFGRPWYVVLGWLGLSTVGFVVLGVLIFLFVQGVAWILTTPNSGAG